MESLAFKTDQFGVKAANSNNPFGHELSLACWLTPKLEAQGVKVTGSYPDGWGWELACNFQNQNYLIGLGSIPHALEIAEWRVVLNDHKLYEIDGAACTEDARNRWQINARAELVSRIHRIFFQADFEDLRLVFSSGA